MRLRAFSRQTALDSGDEWMKGMWMEVWIWIVQKVETSLCIQRIWSWIVRVAVMSFEVRSWFQPGPAVCARFASLRMRYRGAGVGDPGGPCFYEGYFGVIGGLEGVIIIDDIRDDISGYSSTNIRLSIFKGRNTCIIDNT
jgi:hypothetical protein